MPALERQPLKRGVCVKVYTTPKKPNYFKKSCKIDYQMVLKLQLIFQAKGIIYKNTQLYYCGGRVDLPGVRYHI